MLQIRPEWTFQAPHRSKLRTHSAFSCKPVRRSGRQTYCPEMPSGFQVLTDFGSAPLQRPLPVHSPVPEERHTGYLPYAVPGNTCFRTPERKINFLRCNGTEYSRNRQFFRVCLIHFSSPSLKICNCSVSLIFLNSYEQFTFSA